ncbi:MAG: hypothetical protein AAGU74_11625 [Bacillota bacterium]
MKCARILIMLIACATLFTACARGAADLSASQENIAHTPAPIVDAIEPSASQGEVAIRTDPSDDTIPRRSTLYKTDDNGSFALRMSDVAGNPSMKSIEAGRSYDDAGFFNLTIVFEDQRTIQEIINTDLTDEDYFHCVDVTGDGYPEIVFPSLGDKNSIGFSAPLILKIENGQIAEIPLFTINEGSQIFRVQSKQEDPGTITVVSKHTDKKYEFEISPLCKLKNTQENELEFVAPSTGVYSCDIWRIAQNKYGLIWKSFIELWFEINGAGEPYAKIVASIISEGEYDGRQWVITESIQQIEYQR